GLDKVVPPPEQRANLVKAIHVDVGHYGVSKTYSLLSPTYFWVNMFADVRAEVAKCTVCDRVKASFEVKDPTLKPLPIMGMFYRWPIVGARVRDVLHTVVDLDSPQVWATVVEERARLFREEMPIAFNNLAIAQHRDMLRYAHKRCSFDCAILDWVRLEAPAGSDQAGIMSLA
ncbi:hypothetical protein KFL_015770010, partial [Klebsormidium nitens]